MRQHKPLILTGNRKYRFFEDPGHGWLEVPRADVVASGVNISRYSYYDPATDRAYLEEDCDAQAFMKAAGLDSSAVGETVQSSKPRRLPFYGPAAIAQLRVRGDER
jgi:hypothetical protein